jgi:glutathione S-transferase
MKLIGLYDSAYVRRVAISMRVMGFSYEHVALSVFRNVDAFKLYNPLVKAPTLVLSDGQTLTESTFILDYLDERAPERRLMPAAGPERLKALQTLSIALVAIEKAVTLVYETQLRPKELQHAPLLERYNGQLEAALDLLEARLPFAVTKGGALDQVAITSAVAYRFIEHYWPDLLLHGRHRALAALSAQCEQLPSFQATHFE